MGHRMMGRWNDGAMRSTDGETKHFSTDGETKHFSTDDSNTRF